MKPSLLLIPLEHLLRDLQPSSLLFEELGLDPRQLLELYIYEWSQYLNGQGRYRPHMGEFKITPTLVIEEVKQSVVQDQYYPLIRRPRSTESDLFQLVEQVGWNVLGDVKASQRFCAGGLIASIEDWCGDNLIVRIVRP